MIDIDKLPPPDGVSPVSSEALEHAIKQLPPELHDVTFVYQWSNSAGLAPAEGKIKVHLWFWLARPYGWEDLKRWGGAWNNDYQARTGLAGPIDVAVFRTVQAHYVSDPRFDEGRVDHLAHRVGLVERGSNTATLDIPAGEVFGSLGGGAPLECEITTDDTGKIIDGREGYLLRLRQQVVGEDEAKSFEEASGLVWERFREDCAVGPTACSSNIYTPETVREMCRKDRLWKKHQWGKSVIAHFQCDPTTAEKGSEQLRSIIGEFIHSPSDTAVRITSGTGKTSVFCETIARHFPAGKVCHVFVPTHKLAGEIRDRIKGHNPKLRVKVIAGRTEENCRRFDCVDAAVSVGLPVRRTCCDSRPPSDGALDEADLDEEAGRLLNRFRCPFWRECHRDGYESQFKGRADIYIFARQHVALALRPKIPPADFNVVDESFYGVLTHTVECPSAELRDSGGGLGRIICRALEDRKPLLKVLRDKGYTAAVLEEQATKLRSKWAAKAFAASPGDDAARIKAQPRLSPAYYVFRELAKELVRDRGESNKVSLRRERDKTEKVVVSWMRDHRLKAPTLFLDATADEHILRFIKPDIDFHKIDVERRAVVTQVIDHRMSKSSLTEDKNAPRTLATVQRIIDRLGRWHRRGLIVTYKDVKERFVLPAGWEVDYFGNLRGRDVWKDCDTVVLAGRWLKSVHVFEEQAGALAGDSDQAILRTGQYDEEERGYRMREGSASATLRVHPDPLVQACLEQEREAESLQAIDRIRLIHGEEKNVYILSSLPLDLTVDHAVPLKTLADDSVEKMFEELGGVIPWSAPELEALVPDHVPEGRGKDWIKRFRGAICYRVLIANCPSENTFRKVGRAGGVDPRFMALLGHPDPRAALEYVLGELSSYTGPADTYPFPKKPRPRPKFKTRGEEEFWRVFNPPPVVVGRTAPARRHRSPRLFDALARPGRGGLVANTLFPALRTPLARIPTPAPSVLLFGIGPAPRRRCPF